MSVKAASTVKAVLLAIAVTFLISPLTFILSPTANSVEKAVPTPVTDVDAVGSIEPVSTREVPVPTAAYALADVDTWLTAPEVNSEFRFPDIVVFVVALPASVAFTGTFIATPEVPCTFSPVPESTRSLFLSRLNEPTLEK